jgi:hypothetical protein
MTQIKLDLKPEQTKIVNMCKFVNEFPSKEAAITKIIKDWGILQSISKEDIINKVIETIKEDSKNSSSYLIKEVEENLNKAYQEYSKGVKESSKLISKQLSLPLKKVNQLIMVDWESYCPGEDKTDDKIMESFEALLYNLGKEISKKYDCVVEHDEGYWSVESKVGILNITFSGKKEYFYYLDSSTLNIINVVTKVLRGNKSLRDIIDENERKLRELEDEEPGDPTQEEEEETDAYEELMGM